jgi:hypothetical protein
MLYATVIILLSTLARYLEGRDHNVSRACLIIIWILATFLMRDSYPWQQEAWQQKYSYFFLTSATLVYYTSWIILKQWPSRWQKRLDKPKLRTALYYTLMLMSMSLLILRLRMVH